MRSRSGVSLMELMIAVFVLSIGVLASIGTFKYISASIQNSKTRSLASNLTQEQIEKLKNLSYYTLLVTTSVYSDNRVSPPITYDTGNYPPQTIVEGGVTFVRATRVDFAYQNGNIISTAPWTSDDTALKQITTYVLWQEGPEWKHQQVQNLMSNPAANNLSASIAGWVKTPGGVAIPGALVQVIDNPNWYGFSDTSGNYRFSVSPGSYTLQASTRGYYTTTSGSYISCPTGVTATHNFTLTAVSSGVITGNVYINDHVVISQVVASTYNAAGFQQQYVELYNPTTSYVRVVNGMNATVIDLIYQIKGQAATTIRADYSVIDSSIPPHSYYLYANTSPVVVNGLSVAADAVFKDVAFNPDYPHIIKIDADPGSDASGVGIAYAATSNWIDRVGWSQGGNSPPISEGMAIWNEMRDGYHAIRFSRPGSYDTLVGKAYDSDDNNSNFINLSVAHPPRNTASTQLPRAGEPATGAVVSSNDELGQTAQCTNTMWGTYRLCTFSLWVATGTRYVDIALNGYFAQIQDINVTPSASTGVPNGSTLPTWASVGDVPVTLLSDTTSYAFVTGHVYKVGGTALPGIRVTDGNGRYATTVTGGLYTLIASTGMMTLTANPYDTSMNRAYVSQSATPELLEAGTLYSGRDFHLSLGGIIRGYFQTSSNTPLPRRVAVAKQSGYERAQAASDNSGYFYLQNLTTGTYTVEPALDPMESANPTSFTVVLTSTGTTAAVSTFTITSGIAEISGQAVISASSEPITTGVLVIASTVTLGGGAGMLPPTQSGANGGTCSPCYYAASSDALGLYTIMVRNSTNPYKVNAWYNPAGGSPVRVGDYTVTVSSPGAIGTVNLTW